ncbi:H/ACA ribonucleoprotein complex non-core subunit NAF1 [Uranotaenia lowii]|uniref:H/ACA ribonucleoprotein complex non-core subunit NAF1 n=1 Tax=Uranotaenia lowii TaxID=190385 RepID=UPI0024798BA6|nr:H/ACA ribonucleoprotein complex non-core subunit NAF1 [Uranotaenia lowii]
MDADTPNIPEQSVVSENDNKMPEQMNTDGSGIETVTRSDMDSSEPTLSDKQEPIEKNVEETIVQKPSDFPMIPRATVASEKPISYQAQIASEQAVETRAIIQIANSSLSLLSQYSSSESDCNITDSEDEQPRPNLAVPNQLQNRAVSSSDDDSSDDDDVVISNVVPATSNSMHRGTDVPITISDAESSSDEHADEPDYEMSSEEDAPAVPIVPKPTEEIFTHELPPIEDLQISVSATQCKQIGQIQSIVAQIVIVQSYGGVELLNLETVLFLEQGKRCLGKIFDVIGQVQAPMYCVLFNTRQEVLSKGISVGAPVYCAPQTEHTSFIILSDLVKDKGSDASWKHDGECPEHALDYSDDEQERAARRQRRNRTISQSSDPPIQQPQQHPYPMHRPRGRGRGVPQRRYNDHSWHHRITQATQIPPPQQRVINPFAIAAAASQPPPPPPPPGGYY